MHAENAQSVEALGNNFRPAMRAGWLKYIQTAYAAGPASAASSTGKGTLMWVTTSDDVLLPLRLVSRMSTDPNHSFDFGIMSIMAKTIGIIVE